jgi:tetratricopeptide (TPR) repeat protein/SAM-dependent methyltransferase
MNRAKKRQRQKLAVKAAKRNRAIQPAFHSAKKRMLSLQQALEFAAGHLKAGRLSQAKKIYQQILQVTPNQPIALNLLGVIAHSMGRSDIAIDLITKALAVEPDYNDARYNLGLVYHEMGRLDDAVANYNRVLALKPNYVEAHNNLGLLHYQAGHLDEAVASYKKALVIKPDLADAHYNLGNVLHDQGKLEEAFVSHRRATALNPQDDTFWAGVAASLEYLSFTSADDSLREDLLHLLERPTVRPSYIIQPIISALCQHPDFSKILELTGSGDPTTEIAYQGMAKQLSAIPLFLRIMGLRPINHVTIERTLTFLRRAMLQEAIVGKRDKESLAFSASMALQCFINEYVFFETSEETESVGHIEQQIAKLVEKGRDAPPSLVATLGAYRPLYVYPWAQELAEHEWVDDIKEVIERQISEPRQELSLRSQIPRLTPIQDAISQTVRKQYEENPYPRWIKTDIEDKGSSIGTALRGPPLRLDLEDYVSPESPEILVAGCGTGQHALSTASRFSNARVLAVDLSLSSLSYAMRKSKEMDFQNIEYAQGDIMELGNIRRQFDLIECAGVLHHLGDPVAGWRVLVDLLRPGGLMSIGLYSEAARQDIIEGRALIDEKQYTASPEDIRQCRQEIIVTAGNKTSALAKIIDRADFFSLSECRDLLFHVQEQRFTLPQIEAALASLKLQFLGFEMRDYNALKKFRQAHSSKPALTSLSLWHEFELENPDTFRGMYQFWCKRP